MFDPNDAKQLALEIEKIYKRIGLSNPFSSGIHTISELKNFSISLPFVFSTGNNNV